MPCPVPKGKTCHTRNWRGLSTKRLLHRYKDLILIPRTQEKKPVACNTSVGWRSQEDPWGWLLSQPVQVSERPCHTHKNKVGSAWGMTAEVDLWPPHDGIKLTKVLKAQTPGIFYFMGTWSHLNLQQSSCLSLQSAGITRPAYKKLALCILRPALSCWAPRSQMELKIP